MVRAFEMPYADFARLAASAPLGQPMPINDDAA